jgi:hypothetical protein
MKKLKGFLYLAGANLANPIVGYEVCVLGTVSG